MIFGAHQSISGGVSNAPGRGKQATCEAIQIFNKSSNQWKAKELDSKELENYFAAVEETGVAVVTSHTSYLINIASPDEVLNEKSYQALKIEMERCNMLKIPNLVMHPGAHTGSGEETGLDAIAKNIGRLLDELESNETTLLLETTAGQGSVLGYKFEQLAYIIDRVKNNEYLGVCLDTCHIFAAGYPLSDPKEYRATMKSFGDTIGFDRLKIIHMNDSKKEFGSRKDRHEHIGKGEIGIEAFRNIVNDRRLEKVPLILETPKEEDLKDDVKNLKILRGLVTK